MKKYNFWKLIHRTLAIVKKHIYKQLFTCPKNFLKDIHNPPKMRPLNFEKKITQGAY